MAKNPIKIMASPLTKCIYAGRVSPKTNRFIGDKEVVTESAVPSVALYLLQNELHYKFELDGKKYSLRCVELRQDDD